MTQETGAWTPRRDGPYYCSPACDSRCTWAAYEAVVKRASEVCRALGEGWAPAPDENMGWYCRVRKGDAYVGVPMPHDGVRMYDAWYDGFGVGGLGKTARAALDDMVEVMTTRRDEAQAALELVMAI